MKRIGNTIKQFFFGGSEKLDKTVVFALYYCHPKFIPKITAILHQAKKGTISSHEMKTAFELKNDYSPKKIGTEDNHFIYLFYTEIPVDWEYSQFLTFSLKSDKKVEYNCSRRTRIRALDDFLFVFDLEFDSNPTGTYRDPPLAPVLSLEAQVSSFYSAIKKFEEKEGSMYSALIQNLTELPPLHDSRVLSYLQSMLKMIEKKTELSSDFAQLEFLYSTIKPVRKDRFFKFKDEINLKSLLNICDNIKSKEAKLLIDFPESGTLAKFVELKKLWNLLALSLSFFKDFSVFQNIVQSDKDLFTPGFMTELINFVIYENKFRLSSEKDFEDLKNLCATIDLPNAEKYQEFLMIIVPTMDACILNIKEILKFSPIYTPDGQVIEKSGLDPRYIQHIVDLLLEIPQDISKNLVKLFNLQKECNLDMLEIIRITIKEAKDVTVLLSLLEFLVKEKEFGDLIPTIENRIIEVLMEPHLPLHKFLQWLSLLENEETTSLFLYSDKSFQDVIPAKLDSLNFQNLTQDIFQYAENGPFNYRIFHERMDRYLERVLFLISNESQVKMLLDSPLWMACISSKEKRISEMFLKKLMVTVFLRVYKNLSPQHFEILTKILENHNLDEAHKAKLSEIFFESVEDKYAKNNIISLSKLLDVEEYSHIHAYFLTFAKKRITKKSFTPQDCEKIMFQVFENEFHKKKNSKLSEKVFWLIMEQIDWNINSSFLLKEVLKQRTHFLYKFQECYELADPKPENKMVNSLKKAANNFLENLQKQEITYMEVDLLQNSPQENIKSFCILLSQFLRSPNKPEDLHQEIMSVIEVKKNFNKKVTELDSLFKNFYSNFKEMSTYIMELKRLMQKVDNLKISELIIPNELQPFEKLAELFSPISESIVFKKIYNTTLSNREANGEVLLEDIVEILYEARQKFMQLKDELPKFTAEQFRSLFADVTNLNIEHELDILDQQLDFSDEIRNIRQALEYINNCKEILINYKSFLSIVDLFSLKKTTYTNGMERDLKAMSSENEDITYSELVQKATSRLRYSNVIFRDSYATSTMVELSKAKELIDFLQEKDETELKSIMDYVDEYGDSFFRVDTIKDLIVIRQLLTKLETKVSEDNSDNEFIWTLKKLLETDFKNNKMDVMLKQWNQNISGLSQIYAKSTNREMASKYKVKECYQCSEYHFHLDRNYQYQVDVRYGASSQKSMTFSELFEVKDRSLLVIHSKNSDEENRIENQRELEYLKEFVGIINKIEDALNLLNSLYSLGYPSTIEITVNLINGDGSEVNEFHDYLKELYQNWSKTLLEGYKNFYPLTYLSGRHISYFYNHFVGEEYSETLIYKIANLLHFILEKDVSPYKLTIDTTEIKSEEEFINCLGRALHKLIEEEFELVSFNKPNPNNRIKNGEAVIVEAGRANFESCLLSVFLSEQCSLPSAYQVFICNPNSKWEMIKTFLYRVFFCRETTVFCLAKVEELSMDLQEKLIKMFSSDEKERMYAKLIILTRETDSSLIYEMKKLGVRTCEILSLGPAELKVNMQKLTLRM